MRILRNGMIWQLSFTVGSFSDFPDAIHVVRFNDVGMLQSSAQGAAVTVLYHITFQPSSAERQVSDDV